MISKNITASPMGNPSRNKWYLILPKYSGVQELVINVIKNLIILDKI